MELRDWWFHQGWRLLNRQMIEIVGNGVGYIPIQNLIDLPPESNLVELAKMIANDGLPTRIKNNMLWVYAY